MNDEAFPLARDKAELMGWMLRSRGELDRTLAGIGEANMIAVKDAAGWTVKDQIAHIVAWEQFLLRGLAGLPEHEAAEMSAEAFARIDSTDALNDVFHARTKDTPLSVVLDSFRRSYEQVLRLLESMSDADLQAPFAPDDARPKIEKIRGDTYGHYAEHAGWIRAAVGR